MILLKRVVTNLLILTCSLLYVQTAAALVVEYDFVAEAAGSEAGYSSYTTDGDSAGAVNLTATATNYGSTSYYAYLDDLSGGRPGGLGVCQVLSGTQCDPSSDDNTAYGEMLSLSFDSLVTITGLIFSDGDHRRDRFDGEDFEYRIDGGSWTASTFGTLGVLSTSLNGTTFDFITADTNGHDSCTVAFCSDYLGEKSVFYISALTIETPEPGMVALFLLGLGLMFMSKRQNQGRS